MNEYDSGLNAVSGVEGHELVGEDHPAVVAPPDVADALLHLGPAVIGDRREAER